MNCGDFDQLWNRLLDDEPSSRRRGDATTRLELESSLRRHADACEDCRERHRRYESLLLALRAWSARPEAPAPLLTERVLRAAAPVPPPGRRRRALVASTWAAAAAVLIAATLTIKPSTRPDLELKTPPATESGLLRAAVNNATAASWHLAQLTTEPAARLGREMIDASFTADEPPALELALLDPSAPDSDSFAPELFNRMGGYLTAGVEPVSTSAREAFGFLRPPTPR